MPILNQRHIKFVLKLEYFTTEENHWMPPKTKYYSTTLKTLTYDGVKPVAQYLAQ
jgi:hypothetical protein